MASKEKIMSASLDEFSQSLQNASLIETSKNQTRSYSISFQEKYTEITPIINAEELPEDFTQHDSKREGYIIDWRSKSFSSVDGSKTHYGSILPKKDSVILCGHGNEFGQCCVDSIHLHVESALPQDSNGSSLETSEHCHATRYNTTDAAARKKLIFASILCLVFMVGEIVGGYFAGSLAIMTDAAHLLTDFASFLISLFSIWVASRPATKQMSFGYYRAEVIGALTSVLLIWVVTGILVYLAVLRIVNKSYDIEADIMLITSAVGVGVNIIMGFTLHCGGGHGHSHGGGGGGGGGHGHSHGGGNVSHSHSHSHEEAAVNGKEKKNDNSNINVRAALIHVIGDFLQSIGVFVAALVIYFRPDLGIMDPICTFLFSVLVLITTISILKEVLQVLMEGLPRGINFSEVYETFMSINGVVKVHNLRIWSLSMDKIAMSAHIVVNPGVNTQQILKDASTVIRKKYSFFEMTLQIEDYRAEMQDCSQCQCPKD